MLKRKNSVHAKLQNKLGNSALKPKIAFRKITAAELLIAANFIDHILISFNYLRHRIYHEKISSRISQRQLKLLSQLLGIK